MLDLTHFMSAGPKEVPTSKTGKKGKGGKERPPQKECVLNLFAVVVHIGRSLSSGHYIAFVKVCQCRSTAV